MLIVDTSDKRCTKEARENKFDIGIMIMALGFKVIDEKNQHEAEFRRAVWNGLFLAKYPMTKPCDTCWPIKELMYVKINGNDEKPSAWLARMKKNFISELKRKDQ